MGRKPILGDRLPWFEDLIFRKNVHPRIVERRACEKFSIGARQARVYITAARKAWVEHRSANVEEIRDELDGALRECQERALDDGDITAAVRAATARGQLHGALGPAVVSIQGKLGLESPAMTEGELEARLAELREKQAKKD